ncbi:MAG: tRNA-guanine transglycosylase [Xanthomonadaceae bacterium]|nr:tRNA-guanine transglycosylase [Xanthomonadaceae bacterium]
MQTCHIHRYGGPEQLHIGELPEPELTPDAVRIRVRAAGLNPVDFKTRDGKIRVLLRYRMPLILSNELCGEVVAVGERVRGFQAGDRVAARVAKTDVGAFAEYAVVPAALLAKVPDTVSDIDAAALPLAGLTACQCLTEVLHVKPGQRVLIHVGGGGVGHLAIQLAKSLGAVVATTGSAGRADFLRSLGADEVVDYRSERFEHRIAPVDAVLDTQGGDILRRSIAHTRPGGAVVTIGGLPTPVVADAFGKPFWVRWLFALITRRERALAQRRGEAERNATLDRTCPALPADKPRYLMGVGRPEDIVEAVARGIDMFDCVMPTRNGRTGHLFTRFGDIRIRNARYAGDTRPIDPACGCHACANGFSRSYLRHLDRCGEMLAGMLGSLHNLYYYQELMHGIRAAIEENRFEAFRADFHAARAAGVPD